MAATTAAGADFLMQRAADDLAERLGAVERRFDRAAALFCTTPAAREALLASGKVGAAIRVEADPALLAGADGTVAAPETVPFEPESLDLAVSLYGLHEVNDVPGMLVQIRRALKPDGLFVQWAPTRRVVQSFVSVFPHAILLRPMSVLVGSNAPIPWDRAAVLLKAAAICRARSTSDCDHGRPAETRAARRAPSWASARENPRPSRLLAPSHWDASALTAASRVAFSVMVKACWLRRRSSS